MSWNLRIYMAEKLECWADRLRRQAADAERRKREKRRKKEQADGKRFTFVFVQFSEGGTAYSYLAGEDVYCVGDHVKVPVGDYGHMVYGDVVDVQYLPEEEAPYPLELIKRIPKQEHEAEEAALCEIQQD